MDQHKPSISKVLTINAQNDEESSVQMFWCVIAAFLFFLIFIAGFSGRTDARRDKRRSVSAQKTTQVVQKYSHNSPSVQISSDANRSSSRASAHSPDNDGPSLVKPTRRRSTGESSVPTSHQDADCRRRRYHANRDTADDDGYEDEGRRELLQNVNKLSEIKRVGQEQHRRNGQSQDGFVTNANSKLTRSPTELDSSSTVDSTLSEHQPLTVEDVYMEAMTLDTEIRMFRRQLDDTDQDELKRIIGWCRNTLHSKLRHRSADNGSATTATRSAASSGSILCPVQTSTPDSGQHRGRRRMTSTPSLLPVSSRSTMLDTAAKMAGETPV